MLAIVGRCGGACSAPTWRYVGDAGEASFANSWVNISTGDDRTRYAIQCGRVLVELAAQNGTPLAAIFTFPADVRALITRTLPGSGYDQLGAFAPWHITSGGILMDGAP